MKIPVLLELCLGTFKTSGCFDGRLGEIEFSKQQFCFSPTCAPWPSTVLVFSGFKFSDLLFG